MRSFVKQTLSLLLVGAALAPCAALAAQDSPAVTRGQFVRELWEASGRPYASGSEPFSDVVPGDGTYSAILWCAQSGVAQGVGGGLFLPGAGVTREQAAVMLGNLARASGDGVTAADALSGAADAGQVSAWALADVQWAVAKTILTVEDGALDPQGVLTDEEAAELIQRYRLTSQSFHTLGLTGVANARQLGGYVTADGRTVKDGVLLRTGKLSDATAEDLAILAGFGLTEVIDFRTTAEVEAGPDPELDGVTYTRINVMGDGDGSAASSAVTGIYGDDPVQVMIDLVNAGMASDDMYVSMLQSETGLAGYRAFFQRLLDHEEGAVLWHCTGGKDRAGTAAALLLSALGVDRDTVLQDFILTNDFNAARIAYMAQGAEDRGADTETVQAVRELTGVSYDAMATLLDYIDETYGSMSAFLTAEDGLALTQDQLVQLRDKYLD